MERKTICTELKASNAGDGTFTGLASVYNVVDRHGDVVMPGAFTKSLAESNGEVPLLYQHRQDWPVGLGQLTDGEIGLGIAGKLALDVDDALQAWKRMQAGILKSLSIGYEPIRAVFKDSIRQLQEIKLWEVSLVTIPANPLASILGMKDRAGFDAGLFDVIGAAEQVAAEVKAGRVLSARNVALVKNAMEALAALIAAAEREPEPAEDDEATKARKAEETKALEDMRALFEQAATLAARGKSA